MKLDILLVDAAKIHALAAQEPLCKLKRDSKDPRCGYNRNGYKEGYRNVPYPKILLACSGAQVKEVQFSLYGVQFSALVHG